MTGQLNGKVALVTGAGSGIGQTTALAFAHEGAKVVAVDVIPEGIEETERMIIENRGKAISFKADVSEPQQVEDMVKTAVDTYGRLDCAFNNAGVDLETGVPTHQQSVEAWEKMIAVNLKGVWLCMKYEIEQMLKQGGGAIVNMGSIAGLTGTGYSGYVASKHGVVGITKVAALENATTGIRVNAVCPGAIDTAVTRRAMSVSPEIKEYVENMHPMRRVGKPEEVAQAVVWLCSDAVSFTTGHAFPIDGGYMAT